jgi:hypothetical protein
VLCHKPRKQNGLTWDQAVFFVQRRGLEPPSQLRRQHLKLVCLPVPPPLRMGSDRKGAGVYLRGRGGCKGLASERQGSGICRSFGVFGGPNLARGSVPAAIIQDGRQRRDHFGAHTLEVPAVFLGQGLQ